MSDLHGDVVGLTDSSGELVEAYDYGIHGDRERWTVTAGAFRAKCESTLDRACGSQWGNSRGYTGRHLSPVTGLYDMRARHYDPHARVWFAADPIGFAGGEFDVWGFVGGDPLNHMDPHGLKSRGGPVHALTDSAEKKVFRAAVDKKFEKSKTSSEAVEVRKKILEAEDREAACKIASDNDIPVGICGTGPDIVYRAPRAEPRPNPDNPKAAKTLANTCLGASTWMGVPSRAGPRTTRLRKSSQSDERGRSSSSI